MTLPLPYVVQDEAVQGNFDAIKKLFPLSRKDMKVETPNNVGDAGQPAFQGTWANYNTATHQRARFWKDALGLVHIEGVIAGGVIGTVAFTLPTGYGPGAVGHIFPADTNSGHGRIDIAPTGQVTPVSGGTTYFSLNHLVFKQES